ncbi:hypothetical protein AB0451_37605 [Streptomyces sp. NPDC052000]|uniref:hypothetical protein n=1 Tax=Streptomyces sp. NPDC052000 TaxID=3155676 RepID=UPI00345066E3
MHVVHVGRGRRPHVRGRMIGAYGFGDGQSLPRRFPPRAAGRAVLLLENRVQFLLQFDRQAEQGPYSLLGTGEFGVGVLSLAEQFLRSGHACPVVHRKYFARFRRTRRGM